jgi:uncharacterized protein (TIGR03437 family)
MRRFCLLFLLAADLNAQLSTSAYRVLGQPDRQQQGINTVQATSLNGPGGVALDARGGKVRLYIADTGNSRVLAWPDAHSYGIGDPPALILGQPGPAYSNPQGIGVQGFGLNPLAGLGIVGLAVDPTTGDLYVADSANNRVLRFRDPFANSKAQPDAVYGQPDFNTTTANSSGISASSMSKPFAVALDAGGNLWVADAGNNRLLRFGANSLSSAPPPPADTVIGQKDFVSYSPDAGGTVSASGLDTPSGLAFDPQGNLYVADSNNERVLEFPATLLGPGNQNPAATAVFGAGNLTSRGVSNPVSNSSLALPVGLDVDSSGKVYVASPAFNRVLIFPPAGGGATAVLGQTDFVTTKANAGVYPHASPTTLNYPLGVRVGADGTAYVADVNNSRVLAFPPAAKSAVLVWGQTDFSSNGVDQVKPAGMNSPAKVAIDYSHTPFALYVADTGNNRVLVWKDAANFHSGDPADMVIGQPNLYSGSANGDTPGGQTPTGTSLSAPRGMAVDFAGNLWVADSGNNRVLHYTRPVSQTGRIAADQVLGQADFNSSGSAVVSATSLNLPVGLALGPNGNLFVSDAGNNRVLEFQAGAATHAAAIRVYGQTSFTAGAAPSSPSAQTLNSPEGIFVDPAANLFVADSGANRVVIISNTLGAASAGTPAAYVIGQNSFNATGGSATPLRFPSDVTVDSNGNIYLCDRGYSRVLIFPSLLFLPASGGTATAVIGQQNLSGSAVNWDSTDGRATPEGLAIPFGVYMDRRDTLYVSDSGNNRVVHFLKPTAVLNVADYLPGAAVAQGGLAALFASGLADSTSDPQSSAPWATAILNRQISVNDTITAPLFQVSPGQINFQVPSGANIGQNSISVRLADTGELLAGGPLLVTANSPGFFTLSQDGKGQAAALNQDGVTVNGPSNPATRGSVISLFGTGQGQVSPAVADGAGAPASPLAATVAVPTSDAKTCLTQQPSVCVAIGSTFGNIQFSGLAPNYVGLWQLNVQIPMDAPTGSAVPVRVVINSTTSNLFTIAIK